jgi:hypothetical protein
MEDDAVRKKDPPVAMVIGVVTTAPVSVARLGECSMLIVLQ